MNKPIRDDSQYQSLLVQYLNQKLQEKIQNAYEGKKGIYSIEPEGPPDQIKQEVTDAKLYFDNIIEEEKERLRLIADQENKRVMQLLKQNQEDSQCPLCLEDLPAIFPCEEMPRIMNCCGVRMCKECGEDWRARQDTSKEVICFSCRRPVTTESGKKASKNGSNYRKGMALGKKSADLLHSGKLQKSYDCITKAADLGFVDAYPQLVLSYYEGSYHGLAVEKSVEKAKKLAQEGSDRGNEKCNFFLGKFLYDELQDHSHPETFRLLSLSAYQGFIDAIRTLAYSYYSRAKQSTKFLILGIYWNGKMLETTDGYTYTNLNCHFFCELLDFAMKRCWHPRSCFELEPLTGCSHVPFCNWMRYQAGRAAGKALHCTGNRLDDVFLHMKYSVWMEICANCGNRKMEKLMVCARCKSFSYCSKACQVKHWKAGHKVDCKGHWIEAYFPKIRNPEKYAAPFLVKLGFNKK